MNTTRNRFRSSVILGFLSLGLTASLMPSSAPAAEAGFAFKDIAGQHLDVVLDGQLAARYMYAHDPATPARLHETYKPYLHVFDATGARPITKGPGGQFTHHRGIFIGWNKTEFNGKSYDRWHMKGGEIVHQKFLDQTAGAAHARFTSVTHWNDETGQPILVEARTMTFRRGPLPARLLIDFQATLKAERGAVKLNGDPEHAGVQYRPADEVVKAETTYVFPKAGADPKKDLDYPWVGESYSLGGQRHSVIQFNHPGNPRDTKFSAYRDYGRFGAFFVKTIPEGESLTLNYRFLIAEGEMPAAEFIQKCWDDYAGAANRSPVPPTTVMGGVQKGGAKKK